MLCKRPSRSKGNAILQYFAAFGHLSGIVCGVALELPHGPCVDACHFGIANKLWGIVFGSSHRFPMGMPSS